MTYGLRKTCFPFTFSLRRKPFQLTSPPHLHPAILARPVRERPAPPGASECSPSHLEPPRLLPAIMEPRRGSPPLKSSGEGNVSEPTRPVVAPSPCCGLSCPRLARLIEEFFGAPTLEASSFSVRHMTDSVDPSGKRAHGLRIFRVPPGYFVQPPGPAAHPCAGVRVKWALPKAFPWLTPT